MRPKHPRGPLGDTHFPFIPNHRIFFLATHVFADQGDQMKLYRRIFPESRSWKDVVDAKVAADKAKIPKEWLLDNTIVSDAKSRRSITGEFIESLLDDESRQITSMDVIDLVQSMSEGKLKATQVVTSFCKRAAYAHQLSNLLLEIGFDLALNRARELDDYFEKNQSIVGPLHGIPITLKDQFHVKGLETSMAYVSWIGTFEGQSNTGKEKNFESQIVQELYSLGAIPIGKTTLVQSIWAPETNNNILGYAVNPYNQNMSTGGSSGGEGAMQALRGSAFGIGTDIGGSVSMPASLQGAFSIKPSVGRLSMKGVANSGPGQQVMPTVPGIMACSVATLRVVVKSLVSTEPWRHDPCSLPIPWRSHLEYKLGLDDYTLSFGLLRNDSVVTPHPPISRALEIVNQALLYSAHEVLDWQPPSFTEGSEIHSIVARGDGCPDVYEAIRKSGEPIVPEIQHLFPNGQPKSPIPLPQYEQVVVRMRDFRSRWHDYWELSASRTASGIPVQAIITAVTPYAGFQPGNFYHSLYTSVFNVLDYTTVVIPVTFADEETDIVDPDFVPLTEEDKMNMESYDPQTHHGAPASIQLVGRRLDEERLLSIAQLVVDALQRYKEKYGDKLNQ
ncbi:amidase signature domain-containing protein [Biscogniauxia mediterranea]|nr:amidase signature domain-containing protein [Biscogniauxia mediterranea]